MLLAVEHGGPMLHRNTHYVRFSAYILDPRAFAQP